jgi:hypothetical protein
MKAIRTPDDAAAPKDKLAFQADVHPKVKATEVIVVFQDGVSHAYTADGFLKRLTDHLEQHPKTELITCECEFHS